MTEEERYDRLREKYRSLTIGDLRKSMAEYLEKHPNAFMQEENWKNQPYQSINKEIDQYIQNHNKEFGALMDELMMKNALEELSAMKNSLTYDGINNMLTAIKSNTMTMEEIKATPWYQERPEIIRQAIEKLPPNKLYKFKGSGKQCYLVSYEEPEEKDEVKEVTVTVQKTGKGGAAEKMGMPELDTNIVFGVRPDDLELWPEDEKEDT